MDILSGNPVLVCGDRRDFLAEAESWVPGAPFPLPHGPELDRYRGIFGGAELPWVERDRRAGHVISTGDEFGRAAGRLLAVATGRPHRHVRPDRLLAELRTHQGELVAVVGLADEVAAAGDWPGESGAKVGLVVARDEAALACLVYRTLTVRAAPVDPVFVASHPLLDGAAEADAASFAELANARGSRPRLLVLRGQGRECCISVLDGMVCGRSDPIDSPPRPVDPAYRATPCLSGQGCFRTDLTAAELLPAKQVDAALVFMHSCGSVTVGVNAYPLRISVGLGLLEGTAVAVIGVLGVHVLQPRAHWDLEEALADGLPLGDVVVRLHDRSDPLSGALSRFGLLGDPALVLPLPRGARAARQPRRDEESLRRLTELDQVTIPALERMRWLHLDLPDAELLAVRGRVRDLFGEAGSPLLASWTREVEDDLAAVQHRMVELMVARIYSPGWDPGWIAWGFRQVAERPAVCTNCRRPVAAQLVLRHRVEPNLHLHTLQCRRCGDIWWSTDPTGPAFAITGALEVDLPAGSSTHVEREITNLGGEVLRGGVGHAFRARKNLGMPPGAAESCTLGPGDSLTYLARFDLSDRTVPTDTHTMPVVAVLNGIFVSSMTMVHLG